MIFLPFKDISSNDILKFLPDFIVDLFRRPDLVMTHVEEAIEIGAKAIWMQLNVWNQEAAELALFEGAKLGIQCRNDLSRARVADPPNHPSLTLSSSGDGNDPAAQQAEGRKAGEEWQSRQLKARALQPLA